MLRFYYNPKYKYTNRSIIDISSDNSYRDIDYVNIDSPDTINGHIIYTLAEAENIPTYIVDLANERRYYITGITQLRTGKLQISLLRDIISEAPMNWKEEESYISAGLATDFNKYKRWDLPFTNTKVKEERLNISGKSSFFVYYVNQRDVSDQGVITETDLELSATTIPGADIDFTVTSLSEIPSYEFIGNQAALWSGKANVLLKTSMAIGDHFNPVRCSVSCLYDENADTIKLNRIASSYNSNYLDMFSVSYNNINGEKEDQVKEAVKNWYSNYKTTLVGPTITQADINNLSPYVGKIIYDASTLKYYRLNLSTNIETFGDDVSKNETGTLRSAISNIDFARFRVPPTFNVVGDSFVSFTDFAITYLYELTEIGIANSFNFNLSANKRKLPKSAVRCVNIVSDENVSDQDLAQALMIMQANAGNIDQVGRIVDIQYLPFSIATTTDNYIKINNVAITAKFLDLDDYYFTTNLTNLTNINKETDSIKIVSPSRASQFLFRPYNNDGKMTFMTKITLKPFTTTIYVRPSTQGLLIYDWDDKDCLMIQEDMSLTQLSSEWANYVYSNRNYQNAFNRQIQGREFERTWERRVEQAQAKSDEWTARNISAQKAQTYTGNLPIISGIAGAIGTAFTDTNYLEAARLDREYNEAIFQESLSLARDQFSYQIDNIQSQPTLPSSVTTIDIKFLDGIYLEYYSTNETEKTAIQNYYKYNGNRIDAYGTFDYYYGPFVRGKIIKSNYYTQPEIDELNRRLGLGIFTEVAQ